MEAVGVGVGVAVAVVVGVAVGVVVAVGVGVAVGVVVGVGLKQRNQMTENEFKRLRADVECSKEEAIRAEGELKQIHSQIKEEFGCSNMGEAKKKLAQLSRERDAAKREFDDAVSDYEKEWKE